MGICDGILLCSDIDGTLVSRTDGLRPAVRDAVAWFQREGGRFTVATGRMPAYIRTYGIEPNAPVIALNGTAVVDLATNTLMRGIPMPDARRDALTMIPRAAGLDRVYLTGLAGAFEWDAHGDVPLGLPPGGEVYKALFRFFREEDALAFRDRMRREFAGRYCFERSWMIGVEMYHPDGGKGAAVRFLKEHLSPPVRLAVAVGDYENDLSMLRAADLSFAPANAAECARAAASRPAPSCEEDAIAWVIRTLAAEYPAP